jgi:hypothetical protein
MSRQLPGPLPAPTILYSRRNHPDAILSAVEPDLVQRESSRFLASKSSLYILDVTEFSDCIIPANDDKRECGCSHLLSFKSKPLLVQNYKML